MTRKQRLRPITWAYGITTVPERIDKEFTQTLHSLCDAGFPDPHIFVDGCDDPSLYSKFERRVSCTPKPPISIVGNWMLGMWELYVRDHKATYYAMFQDDILAVGNLREYLEKCEYPKKGYWNLYCHEENRKYTNGKPGWQLAFQKGLGALGLIFDRTALQTVMNAGLLIRKPASAQRNRATKALDGGILEGMKNAGYKEYVHNPSLLQHTGGISSLNNHGRLLPIDSFPGTDFDALTLLQ